MKLFLLVMLGYPGPGKSFFARQLAKQIQVVRLNGDNARHIMFNSDNERYNPLYKTMVFGALDYATLEILNAGYSVIYDASHNRRSDRQKALRLVKKYGVYPIIIWTQVPRELAKARVQTREVRSDQPVLPMKRFAQLVASLQPPDEQEKAIIIDGTQQFTEQLESFQAQLARFLAGHC